jgi:SAM-dependent methyltransferase
MNGLENWKSFFSQTQRDPRMAELWTRDVVQYLRTHPRLGRDSAILDFGCGYFDVGGALAPDVARIDGLEIDTHSLNRARLRTADFAATAIYAASDDVPHGAYNLIFANSVFQYLANDAEILNTLNRFRKWLKPGGEVLLIDLIPTRYSPTRDAFRSLFVAARHGILIPMIRFLWNAATSPHGRTWHRIDPPRLTELAAAADFTCTVLDRNLTPSFQRYTTLLQS